MEVYNVIVGFFQNGGVFMIPIVVILALGAAIAIERWVFLTITTVKNKALWNAVTPYLKAGNFAGAMQVTSKSGAVIGQIMTYGLNRVRSARRREDIEQAMEESLMEVLPRLEKRTHYLATFANMATLMGLLGTIIGLIDAFTAVSNANPAEKAELLSAQYLDRHELHGVRPHGRDSARAHPLGAADEDDCNHRQPRDGVREVLERDHRARARGQAGGSRRRPGSGAAPRLIATQAQRFAPRISRCKP